MSFPLRAGVGWALVSPFAPVAVAEPLTRWLKEFILRHPGGGTSEQQVGWPAPPEASLLGVWMATSPCVLTWSSLRACLSSGLFF